MVSSFAVVIAILILAGLMILVTYYEDIVLPLICFATAAFFIYYCIYTEVYIMLLVPAFCIFWGVIHLIDQPITLRKRDKKDKNKKEDEEENNNENNIKEEYK